MHRSIMINQNKKTYFKERISSKKYGVLMKKIIIVAIFCFFIISKFTPIHGQQEKIPVLMYHHLENNLNSNVVISPESFEDQIRTLKEEGYNSISSQQLYDFLNYNIKLPENPVLITFDDGYLSNYELAYPILKKYGMHAEIFVITSQILEKNEKTSYLNEIPKMNWDQLRAMQDFITIQSHTWDSHYKLVSNNGVKNAALYGPGYINNNFEEQLQYEERVKNDLILSRKLIKEKLGYEPIVISYPFGIKSEDTIELSKVAGFKMGYVIENKKIIKGDNLFSLSRITVNGNETGDELIKKLKS